MHKLDVTEANSMEIRAMDVMEKEQSQHNSARSEFDIEERERVGDEGVELVERVDISSIKGASLTFGTQLSSTFGRFITAALATASRNQNSPDIPPSPTSIDEQKLDNTYGIFNNLYRRAMDGLSKQAEILKPPPILDAFKTPPLQEEFYCNVCMENVAISLSFTPKNCIKKHQFCKDCVESYFTHEIQEGNVENISCPLIGSTQCGGVIEESEIKSIVTREIHQRYLRLNEIKRNQNARECPSCSHIQIGDGSHPNMTCDKCQTQYCFIHANAHPNEACHDYIKRTCREEKKNQRYIQRMAKECPNCKAPTEKSGGCNHMTCQHCGFGWCWLCSRPYTYDHYDINNENGCPGKQFADPLLPSCDMNCTTCTCNCENTCCTFCVQLTTIIVSIPSLIIMIFAYCVQNSYGFFVEAGFIICTVITSLIVLFIIIPIGFIGLLMYHLFIPQYRYVYIHTKHHKEPLVQLPFTEQNIRGRFRICSTCGSEGLMEFACHRYCGFHMCTQCVLHIRGLLPTKLQEYTVIANRFAANALHVPMWKHGRRYTAVIENSTNCFEYRQALGGPSGRAVDEVDISKMTVGDAASIDIDADIREELRCCFFQQPIDFWEKVWNAYLWIFLFTLILIPFPIVLVYSMFSLISAMLLSIPVCFYFSCLRWFVYSTTGCWFRGMVSNQIVQIHRRWVGSPVENFIYRLKLFDENNELGLFKIFDQLHCSGSNSDSKVWWKLSTHVLQFGARDPTIYDNPSGFFGYDGENGIVPT